MAWTHYTEMQRMRAQKILERLPQAPLSTEARQRVLACFPCQPQRSKVRRSLTMCFEGIASAKQPVMLYYVLLGYGLQTKCDFVNI